jgi:hypothetical protein
MFLARWVIKFPKGFCRDATYPNHQKAVTHNDRVKYVLPTLLIEVKLIGVQPPYKFG